ncbi:hypothetical protein ATANTOWER_027943 [Ataeniobius toweri]|uniref:Uncharacterized protein n=1 Tax=Ataeniobius toweri TaxID=208326 RepID=A0ABU7AJC4_9TELE|nr:hypothetical protein [Ataeniobius toweri]
MFPVHQMLVIKVVPNDWSPGLDQEDSKPPHIKEEEEELCISPWEEQLTVKIEDDEKQELSKLQQIKTEDNRETDAPVTSSAEELKTEYDRDDCEEPERNTNTDPVCSYQHKMTVYRRVCQCLSVIG